MIKRGSIALLAVICGRVFAQQDPQFTQYMFNRLFINPAYAGSSENINSAGLFRNQWAGLAGHPVTGLISADAPIKKIHGAIGLTALYDQIGGEKTVNTKIAYSYFLPFKNSTLSFGADIGYMYKQIVNQFISNTNSSVAQEKIYNGFTIPDVGMGIYFYSKKFYAGVSSTHITQPGIKMSTSSYNLSRHFYLTCGKKIAVTEKLFFEPSFLIKSDIASTQVDLNANIYFKDFIITGVGYRPGDAVLFLLGFKIAGLHLAYSYDYGVSSFTSYLGNSHEVILGYSLNKKVEKKQE